MQPVAKIYDREWQAQEGEARHDDAHDEPATINAQTLHRLTDDDRTDECSDTDMVGPRQKRIVSNGTSVKKNDRIRLETDLYQKLKALYEYRTLRPGTVEVYTPRSCTTGAMNMARLIPSSAKKNTNRAKGPLTVKRGYTGKVKIAPATTTHFAFHLSAAQPAIGEVCGPIKVSERRQALGCRA